MLISPCFVKDMGYFEINRACLKKLQSLIEVGIVESFAELAIRFVAFDSSVHRVIPGAKSVLLLEENIRAVHKGPLSLKAVNLIDELRLIYLPRLIE